MVTAIEKFIDVDVQAAAVRMISRAQWFLMSLPIAAMFQTKENSRIVSKGRIIVRPAIALRSRLVSFIM